jgi:cytosine/adenosine deaminase-related metal-dependent hydrolase
MKPLTNDLTPPITRRYRFDAAIDATGLIAAPAEAVVAFDESPWPAATLLELRRAPARSGAGAEPRPGQILLPAFVNAHTHLDLTHIGPRPFDPAEGFDAWLRMILSERCTDEDAIAESVEIGVHRCLAGGVVAVGDIAGIGSLAPTRALRDSPLIGASYVEFFGLGRRQQDAIDQMEQIARVEPLTDRGVRLGLSPHAPYTAGPRVCDAAARLARDVGLAASTHLAESRAERDFIERAEGPMRDLLDSMGVLDEDALRDLGRGDRPVAHLEPALRAAPWLLAHACDLTDEEIDVLAQTRCAVAYCPRSSAYFAHDQLLGPHRYRDLIRAGVPVALGTDSIVNLPALAADARPTLGVLDEMRFLYRRDRADPLALLAMATTSAARALHLDESLFTLAPGAKAGLCALAVPEPTLEAALETVAQPELLTPPTGP